MAGFVNMTAAEFRAWISKTDNSGGLGKVFGTKKGTSNRNKAIPEQKSSKYNAEKTKVGKKTFDSKKEAQRYLVLKELQKEGKIEHLECQKPFLLQEGFRDNTGKYQRPITYVCDFFYHDTETDEWIVEDVKSIVTAKLGVYRIKRKMFLLRYPEYKFKEAI